MNGMSDAESANSIGCHTGPLATSGRVKINSQIGGTPSMLSIQKLALAACGADDGHSVWAEESLYIERIFM
jgi:hypothetical protein